MLRWTPIGGSPSTVVRRSRFAPRTRFCIFFKATGPVSIHYVDRGDTIDHRYNLLLKKFFSKDQRHARKLHHDNAKAHILSTISNQKVFANQQIVHLLHHATFAYSI